MKRIISITPDGTLRMVYTDDLPLEQFGVAKVQRASNVEFNELTQEWEVTFTGDMNPSYRNASRANCIAWEVSELNRRLYEGTAC